MTDKKSILPLLAVVVLLVLAIATLFILRYHKPSSPPPAAPSTSAPSPVSEGNFAIKGQLDCLPPKDTTKPVTMECAYGFRDQENRYYILEGLSQEALMEAEFAPGNQVTITGEIIQSDSEKFAIVGTIKIASIVASQ